MFVHFIARYLTLVFEAVPESCFTCSCFNLGIRNKSSAGNYYREDTGGLLFVTEVVIFIQHFTAKWLSYFMTS